MTNETQTLTITIPAEGISIKAAGHSETINPSAFAAETLSYLITYGVRRGVQDRVNAQAKALRDEGKPVDGAELVAAVVADFTEGNVSVRGPATPGFTEEEARVYELAVSHRTQTGFGAVNTAYVGAKGLTTKDRMTAVLSAVNADEKMHEALSKVAKAQLKAEASLASIEL